MADPDLVTYTTTRDNMLLLLGAVAIASRAVENNGAPAVENAPTLEQMNQIMADLTKVVEVNVQAG